MKASDAPNLSSKYMSKIEELKAQVFAEPLLNPSLRTANEVMWKPLRSRMLNSHWEIKEVWDWPKAVGIEWRNLKKESIKRKLEALAERGKGPLSRQK